jgi:hypothetical protein
MDNINRATLRLGSEKIQTVTKRFADVSMHAINGLYRDTGEQGIAAIAT